MSGLPARPVRPKPTFAKENMRGTLLDGSLPASSVKVSSPGISNQTTELQKFAQLILFGVAAIGIWSGIFAIAFSGNTTSDDYLFLGIGGLVSATLAIAMVEFQIKRGGKEIQNVHDYMIGVAFFFAGIGVLYTVRYLIGIAAKNGFEPFIDGDEVWSNVGWEPAAEAIYLHVAALIILVLCERMYLKRLSGTTTFGWSVATFTPLIMTFVGMGPWLNWSNGIVSWELGIAIISLVVLTMWYSVEANSSIIFSVVAVTCGLIPLFYELSNDVSDGGAISLMVFIIGIQGFMASDRRLRQDIMQWTSALLVGEVILVMMLATGNQELGDWELILGPLRQYSMPDFIQPYFTLQNALWFAMLFAYFPATLMRRIPYMPIGLAGSLWIIEQPGGMIPWITALVMLPYLLVISKVTREWVANWSMLAICISFFMQTHQLADTGEFKHEIISSIILLAILVSGELGRTIGHLSDWAHFTGLGILVLSEPVLFGDDPFVPWAVVIYAIGSAFMMMNRARENDSQSEKVAASFTVFASMAMAVVLSAVGRLDVPLTESLEDSLHGFNAALALVGLSVYAVFYKFKNFELDLGALLMDANNSRKNLMPVYDSGSQSWNIIQDTGSEFERVITSWGPLGRTSLIGPMILFSTSLFSMDSEILASEIVWILLMTIPLGIIVKEVIDDKDASSEGRMIATWTMFFVALPVSFKLILEDSAVFSENQTQLLFDAMLLAGPLLVSFILTKRGLNDDRLNPFADNITLLGLLAIGFLDSSGGLLFLGMYYLVFSRAFKHRQNFILCFAPFMFVLQGFRLTLEGSLVYEILEQLDITSYDPMETTVFGLSRFSCAIIALSALVLNVRAVQDKRLGNPKGNDTPIVIPAIWLFIGMIGILPEASWLLLALALLVTFEAWLLGRLEIMAVMPFAFFVSFLIGFEADSNFNYDGWDLISYSLLGSSIISLGMYQMCIRKTMYKWAEDAEGADFYANGNAFATKTQAGREQLEKLLYGWSIGGLTLSFNAFKGIGTVIGSVWVAWDVITRGQKYMALVLPLLLSLSYWNLTNEFELGATAESYVVGIILTLSGAAMTVISSKPEIAWNWEKFDWKDEVEYYGWIDRVGQLAICYILTGLAAIISFGLDLESMLWVVWAIYLSGISIQGFRDETETPWRRGLGSFGCLFSLFMLSTTLEDIYTYITWMGMGVVALGFGFAYIARMGEENALLDQSYSEALMQMNTEGGGGLVKEVTELPPSRMQAIESKETKEDVEVEEDIEVVEDVEDIEVVEEIEEETEVEDDSQFAILENNEEESLAPTQPIKSEHIQTSSVPFDVILHPSMSQIIEQQLRNTPHEGFKPVIGVSPNGNIKIDFVPL